MNIWQDLLTWMGVKKQNTAWVATPAILVAVTKFETSLTNVESVLNQAKADAAALVALVPEIQPEVDALLTGLAAGELTVNTFVAGVNAAIATVTGQPFPTVVPAPTATGGTPSTASAGTTPGAPPATPTQSSS
jgi:hypothetical protein